MKADSVISVVILLCLMLLNFDNTEAARFSRQDIRMFSSTTWEPTNGPEGGVIFDVAINPQNPDIMYAAGSPVGVYKTEDGGETWVLKEFRGSTFGYTNQVEINPDNPDIVFCRSNFLYRSTNGGETWDRVSNAFDSEHSGNITSLALDPENPDMVYAGTGSIDLNWGGAVYKSTNGGGTWLRKFSWEEYGTTVDAIGVMGDGKIIVAVNDWQLLEWHTGRVFVIDEGSPGNFVQEVNYGRFRDRHINNLYVNPNDRNEIWIGESELYSQPEPPMIFRTSDGGDTWETVDILTGGNNVWLLGQMPDGRFYVGDGAFIQYTTDGGQSFVSLDFPVDSLRAGDFKGMAVDPQNPSRIVTPLSEGVAISEDGGSSWKKKATGIANTTMNVLACDPSDPSVIYIASQGSEGVFKSRDYGLNWRRVGKSGVQHAYCEDLVIDPTDRNKIWFSSDIISTYKSVDAGESWTDAFGFNTPAHFAGSVITALAQSDDGSMIYAVQNGFGIHKGSFDGANWQWALMALSGVDYTSTLAVEPGNTDVVYSSYNAKRYEPDSKIRASYDGGDTWTTALELFRVRSVSSIAVDPHDVSTVLASLADDSLSGLRISNDRGQTWENPSEYFDFTNVHELAAASDGSQVAYAEAFGHGLYRTTDAGSTWNRLEWDSYAFSSADMTVDPVDPDIVYVADNTAPVLFRSTDGGASWQEYFDAGSTCTALTALAVDPLDSGKLYLTGIDSEDRGYFYLLDNGQQAGQAVSLPGAAAAITAGGGNIFLVLLDKEVLKSTDSGASWTDISASLPEAGFTDLFIDPADENTLYLCGGSDIDRAIHQPRGLDPDSINSVYRSRDGGQSWENAGRGALGSASGTVRELAFHEDSPNAIYLATDNGIFFSTDNAESWQQDNGLPFKALSGISILGDAVLASTQGAGVFRGTINADYTITWDSERKFWSDVYHSRIVMDPVNEGVIYASAWPGGVFRSADGGSTWRAVSDGLPGFEVYDPYRQGYYTLAVSRSDPEVLYAGMFGQGVWRSVNGGETWQPAGGGSGELAGKPVTSLAVSLSDPDRVYAATRDLGVYESSNGGESWSAVNQGLTCMHVKVLYMNEQNELYAGTGGYGVFRLESGSWMPLSQFTQTIGYSEIWGGNLVFQEPRLLINPADNSKMLIGTFTSGVFRSEDSGESWTESNAGWQNEGSICLVSRPQDHDIVYAGTYNGLNRSNDFGRHWEKLTMDGYNLLNAEWVTSIDFDPTDPDIIYIASQLRMGIGGINSSWAKRSTDGGETWEIILTGNDGSGEGYDDVWGVSKVIVDRIDPNTLYVMSHNGVFISRDAGESWQQWSDGLSNRWPAGERSLVMSADNSVLYFGSQGSGVFRRIITPILPVNGLHAEVSAGQVTLSWTFRDYNDNFAGFNVYKSTTAFESPDGMSPAATISSSYYTTYTDTDVQTGVQYYYAVSTTDRDGYENGRVYVLGPVVLAGDEPESNDTLACDFNNDGAGNIVDVMALILRLRDNPDDPAADMNNDGSATLLDAILLLNALREGKCGTPGTLLVAAGGDGDAVGLELASEEAAYLRQVMPGLELSAQEQAAFLALMEGTAARAGLPKVYSLAQNAPNPFNPSTSITYTIPESAGAVRVDLSVYDLRGRLVRKLVGATRDAGSYTVLWDGTDSRGRRAASGVYLYRIRAGEYVGTRKMVLLK